MMDYQTAVRGAFFDIAGVAETPDEVAAQARYLDDGLLFLQEGKIIAVGPGKRDNDGNIIPLDVKAGDRVLFSKYGGVEVKIEG